MAEYINERPPMIEITILTIGTTGAALCAMIILQQCALHYFAHTKLDIILHAMEIASGQPRSAQGLSYFERVFIMRLIAEFAASPANSIRAGYTTAKQIRAIPKNLKMQLITLVWIAHIWIYGMALILIIFMLLSYFCSIQTIVRGLNLSWY